MRVTEQPDWGSSPWETIADILTVKRIAPAQFEEMLGEQPGFAEQLKAGLRRIDVELASALAESLGASPNFWLKRDADFIKSGARPISDDFESTDEWIQELPVKDMIRAGWIKKNLPHQAIVVECLKFFGLSDFSEWNSKYRKAFQSVAFRKSSAFSENALSTLTWLRQGERTAAEIKCDNWDRARFSSLLADIRPLTRQHNPKVFLSELVSRCASAGVAVVIARAPAGCRASGAARMLSGDRALIQLSFRYLSDDHFWFTFFHEAAHLVLHSDNHLFLENDAGIMQSEEREANDFAAEMLIPSDRADELRQLKPLKRDIMRFAFSVGTSPGIVVGQMQHRKLLQQNRMNFLKRRYNWAELN